MIEEISGSRKNENSYRPVGRVVDYVLERIEKARMRGESIDGISTGLREIDMKMGGLHPGDLILIGGRPCMGKTAMALSMAYHVAVEDDNPVFYFTLKESAEQLVNHLIEMDSGLDLSAMKIKTIDDREMELICKSARRIADAPFYICDQGIYSVKEICSACQQWENVDGKGLIIIDDCRSRSKMQENRKSVLPVELKLMARELAVPVVILMDAPEHVDYRPDHRLNLSDFNLDMILYSDLALFLYRDDYYEPDSEQHGVMEILISQNRYGCRGQVEVEFNPWKNYRVVDLKGNRNNNGGKMREVDPL